MRRRTLVAGLFLAVLTTACGSNGPPTGPGPIVTPPDNGPPTTPAPPPTLGTTRILSFGDSMTEGTTSLTFTPFTLTPGLPQSYPFKLQTLLTTRYSAQTITVANAGQANERVANARTRFNSVLSEARPEVALLMEGANDLNSLPDGVSNVTPIMGAMEDLVRDATGRGIQVLLATIPPQRLGGQRAARAGLVDSYNSELKVMAGKKGATIVDVNALLPLSAIGQDGLHPTEAGYQMLAEIFFDAIKAKYEAPASARR